MPVHFPVDIREEKVADFFSCTPRGHRFPSSAPV
jgi:hypothetical protein